MTIYHTAAVLKRCLLSMGGGADEIRGVRNLGWGRSKCDPQPPPPPRCPDTACNLTKKAKQGLLSWLLGKKETPSKNELEELKATPEIKCCCRKYLQRFHEIHAEPDFSEFGGKAYKTCGIAYIIQRDRLPTHPSHRTKEDHLLKEIETHLDLKGKILRDDPVKETENMYGRLLEMTDKGLHPMYKKISATPPLETMTKCKSIRPYKAVTGPIDSREVPAQVVVNWAALDKKNISWVHKRVQQPQQLVGRLIETKLASCPKGQIEICTHHEDDESVPRDTVFDTLKQKPVEFIKPDCTPKFCKKNTKESDDADGCFCKKENDD